MRSVQKILKPILHGIPHPSYITRSSMSLTSQRMRFFSTPYLDLKSHHHKEWEKKWDSMRWEIKPGSNYAHINFGKVSEANIEDKGKFFKFSNCEARTIIPEEEDKITHANMLVLTGVLSSTRTLMALALNQHQSLATILKISPSAQETIKPLVVCPLPTNQQRYHDAMQYGTQKSSFYSTYIENITRRYFLPRLLTNQKTTVITYSVGGREIMMVENAIRHILGIYGYPLEKIQSYLENLQSIMFGYAIDHQNLPEPRSKKIIILSASDQRVLIPKELYLSLYTKENCEKFYTINTLTKYETLLFLGHKSAVEVLDGEKNYDGHRLPHYVNSLSCLNEDGLKILTDTFTSSLDLPPTYERRFGIK